MGSSGYSDEAEEKLKEPTAEAAEAAPAAVEKGEATTEEDSNGRK